MKRSLVVFVAALLLAAAPAGVRAATFADVLTDPGVAWISDVAPAIPHERPAMHQTDRAFVPELLVVPVGASVAFPNDDPSITASTARRPATRSISASTTPGPARR